MGKLLLLLILSVALNFKVVMKKEKHGMESLALFQRASKSVALILVDTFYANCLRFTVYSDSKRVKSTLCSG